MKGERRSSSPEYSLTQEIKWRKLKKEANYSVSPHSESDELQPTSPTNPLSSTSSVTHGTEQEGDNLSDPSLPELTTRTAGKTQTSQSVSPTSIVETDDEEIKVLFASTPSETEKTDQDASPASGSSSDDDSSKCHSSTSILSISPPL